MNKYASTKSEETLLNFNERNYEMYSKIKNNIFIKIWNFRERKFFSFMKETTNNIFEDYKHLFEKELVEKVLTELKKEKEKTNN